MNGDQAPFLPGVYGDIAEMAVLDFHHSSLNALFSYGVRSHAGIYSAKIVKSAANVNLRSRSTPPPVETDGENTPLLFWVGACRRGPQDYRLVTGSD